MAATSILCDFIVFLLPLPVLLCRVAGSGSITNNQHLVSAATFACGLLTTVVSIARAVYLREVQNGNGDNTMVVLMGVVEINVGVCSQHTHSKSVLTWLTDNNELSALFRTTCHGEGDQTEAQLDT